MTAERDSMTLQEMGAPALGVEEHRPAAASRIDSQFLLYWPTAALFFCSPFKVPGHAANMPARFIACPPLSGCTRAGRTPEPASRGRT